MLATSRWTLAFVLASVAAFFLVPGVPAWAACGKAFFSPQNYAVKENGGQVVLSIILMKDYPDPRTRSVSYQAKTGIAKSGADFTAESGTLTFSPGDTSESFDIGIVNDSTDESVERFEVLLKPGPGSGCVSLGPDATVAIQDDDPTPKPSPSRGTETGPLPPGDSSGSSPSGSGSQPAVPETPSTASPTPTTTVSPSSPSPIATALTAADLFGEEGGGLSGLALAGIAIGAIGVGSTAAVFVRRRFLVTQPPS